MNTQEMLSQMMKTKDTDTDTVGQPFTPPPSIPAPKKEQQPENRMHELLAKCLNTSSTNKNQPR